MWSRTLLLRRSRGGTPLLLRVGRGPTVIPARNNNKNSNNYNADNGYNITVMSTRCLTSLSPSSVDHHLHKRTHVGACGGGAPTLLPGSGPSVSSVPSSPLFPQPPPFRSHCFSSSFPSPIYPPFSIPRRPMSYFWRARRPSGRRQDAADHQLKEVTCQVNGFRASWKKVNPLLRQIRGLPASEGLLQLQFSQKHKFAPMVSRVLQNACNLADIRHGLSEDDVVIREATVGKGTPLRGVRYHGRGRFGQRRRPKCHIRVVLQEMTPMDQYKKLKPYRRKELGLQDPAEAPPPPPPVAALTEGPGDGETDSSSPPPPSPPPPPPPPPPSA